MSVANVERTCLFLTVIHILLDDKVITDADTFTLGYITGSKRRPGDFEYQRPGFRISGAITLAVEEASNFPSTSLVRHIIDHNYSIAETDIMEFKLFLYHAENHGFPFECLLSYVKTKRN